MLEPISVYDLVGEAIYSEKRKIGFVVQEVRMIDGQWMVISSHSRLFISSLIDGEFKLGEIPLADILRIEE